MRYILYAKGSRGLIVLKALIEKRLPPNLVVLEKNDNHYSELLLSNNITTEICNKPKNTDHIHLIRNISPSLIVAAGYSKIFPKELIDIPEFCTINCHGGRLPYYRGASPIPWQIINGETKGGAYILVMTPGIDDGPIIASEEYAIDQKETARHITDRVNTIFEKLVPMVVEKFKNGEPPETTLQESEGACVWTRRVPQDGLILWDQMTAEEIINLIRALDDPYPGAFTFCKGQKLIIKEAIILATKMKGVPGRFAGIRDGLPAIIAKDRAIGIKSYIVENDAANKIKLTYGDNMAYSL